jgi:hypothetical protein
MGLNFRHRTRIFVIRINNFACHQYQPPVQKTGSESTLARRPVQVQSKNYLRAELAWQK